MKKIIIVFSILAVIFLLTGCPNVVNYTPKLEITDQRVTEGQTLTVDLREFTFDRNMEKLSEKPWDEKEKMVYFLVSGKGEISEYDYIYSPGYTEEGTYTVQIKVTDNWGSVANDSFALTVIGANATPTIEIPDPEPAFEGQPYSIDLGEFTTDPDLDELTFELLTDEGTITGNTFSFNPDFVSSGTHTITIRVIDAAGASYIYTFEIFVNDVNRAPVIDTITDKTVNENEELIFIVNATDADGDALSYNLEGPGTLTGNSYSWSPDYDSSGTYDATITISDGEDSDFSNFKITVNDINRSPSISIPNKTMLENSTLSFDLSQYASDPDGDTLTYSLVSGVGAIEGASTFKYVVDYSAAGTHGVRVKVEDDRGLYAESTFNIEVANVNRAPVMEVITDKTVNENEELIFTVIASDPDGDVLRYRLEGPGTLTGNSYSWTPDYDASGTYDVTINIDDGNLSVSRGFKITVNDVNRAPVVKDLSWTFFENTSVSINFIARYPEDFYDPDGDSFNFEIVSGPGSITDTTYSYYLDYESEGNYTWKLKAVDERGAFSTFVIEVEVYNNNRRPVIEGITDKTINENEELAFSIIASDLDGDTLTYNLEGPGYLTGNSYSLTPDYDASGTYDATVTVSDGTDSASTSFEITVNDVNRAPAMSIPNKIMLENSTLSFDLSQYASDPDGDALTYSVIKGVGATDEATFNYTADYEADGTHSATVKVEDGRGLSAESTFNIVVTDVNRAPIVDDMFDITVEENELFSITVFASDPDGDSLTYGLEGPGSLTGNSYSWKPDFDASGTYTATVTVSDGIVTDSTSFKITVNDVNRSPSISVPNKIMLENCTLSFDISQYASDPDGDALTYSVIKGVGATDEATFNYTADYDASGTHSATVKVEDGRGLFAQSIFNIVVTDVNRDPVMEAITDKTVKENEELSFNIVANDPDGDTLTYNLEGPGTLTGSSYSWTPDYDASGTYDATITVEDYKDSVSTSFRIIVNDVNRAPSINVPGKTVVENSTLSFDLSQYANDPDGDALTYSVISGVGATDEATFNYTTDFDAAGTHSVTVKVEDGRGLYTESTFNIEVANVNRTPVMEAITDKTINENEELSFSIIASDPDSDSLTYSLEGPGTLRDDNTYFWIPSFDASGTYDATITVEDYMESVSASFRIMVCDVNRNPALTAMGNQSVNENETLSLTFVATDPDGDPTSISYDGSGTYNSLTHTLSWTPTYEDSGVYDAKVTVSDGRGGTDSENFSITVADVPRTYNLTVNTTPKSGLGLRIDGKGYVSPETIEVIEGGSCEFSVFSPVLRDESIYINSSDTIYTFLRWDDGAENNERNIMDINSDLAFTAEIEVKYQITPEASPTGITAILGYDFYEAGESVQFTAPEVTGYIFDHWEINGANTGSDNPISVSVDSPKKIIAVYTNASQIEFSRCYGGTLNEEVYDIQQTMDEGYIVVGSNESSDLDTTVNNGSEDYWIVKLDPDGELVWERSLGGSDLDRPQSVLETSDGYMVAGYSRSIDVVSPENIGAEDILLMKLDPLGFPVWQRTLGGIDYDEAMCIQETPTGYIIAGTTRSTNGDVTGNNGLNDYWVIKLDINGIVEWKKCLGGTSNDVAYSVEQLIDGYIIAGYTTSTDGDVKSGNHGKEDCWIVRLDLDGNILWEKCLGGTGTERALDINSTSDGGFIVAGYTDSSDEDVSFNNGLLDYWIVKLYGNGDIEWEKTFGGGSADIGKCAQETDDGGYTVAGNSYSYNGMLTDHYGGKDWWVLKLDSYGEIEWQKSLGGSGADNLNSIQQTADGKYIIAGSTDSIDGDILYNNGSKDFWVVKLREPF